MITQKKHENKSTSTSDTNSSIHFSKNKKNVKQLENNFLADNTASSSQQKVFFWFNILKLTKKLYWEFDISFYDGFV